jgi:preprotein translocase subunit SecY
MKPAVRGRVLLTLGFLAVYRLGSALPVPDVDPVALRGAAATSGGPLAILDLLSGGALDRRAVFALGVSPYISSSIVMQLLTATVPRLEELRREGATGERTLNQWTRYLCLGLAVVQGSALVATIAPGGVLVRALMVLTLVAGSALVMWLGELVTQRGIGNGMSVLVAAGVVSRLPEQGRLILATDGPVVFAAFVVELTHRRIPVTYSRRQWAGRGFGRTATYIPLRLNASGVVPLLFASSLLSLPPLAASIAGSATAERLARHYLGRGTNPAYVVVYTALIVLCAFFYSTVTFNPPRVSDSLRQHGGFVTAVRPGQPTVDHLSRILHRVTAVGSVYLAALALIPLLALSLAHVPFPLGGSAIVIAVGVNLDAVKQAESQMLAHSYVGFLGAARR